QGPKEGPYAQLSLIQPGDWLYIVNKPKTLGTHSLIFVAWEDRDQGLAQVINYVGGRKRKPGDYRSSDISRVFEIRRAQLPE
ncbi:MAG: hypothetical protein RBU37_12440, partial [Myxococcota bacterium]|nr:hypothetical protein [Myxococcota bacterium]